MLHMQSKVFSSQEFLTIIKLLLLLVFLSLTTREWRPHKVENEKNDTKWHCLYDFISRQLAIFCAQLYNDSGHDLIENHNYGTVIYEIVRSWRWKWEMKKVRQKEYWAIAIAINKKNHISYEKLFLTRQRIENYLKGQNRS